MMTNGALQILIVDFDPADQNKTLAAKGYEQVSLTIAYRNAFKILGCLFQLA